MFTREDFIFLDRSSRPVSPKFDADIFPVQSDTLPAMFNVDFGRPTMKTYVQSHTDPQGKHVYCEQ